MRILHLLAPAPVGGLERVVLSLASGQVRRGHTVMVATLLEAGAPEPPLLNRLRDSQVSVAPIVTGRRAYGTQVRRVKLVAAQFGPDVLHSHGYLPDVVALLANRAARLPLVTTVHGFIGGGRKNRLYEWLQMRAHRHFDAVVAVARSVSTRLLAGGVPSARIHVVMNAWSADATPFDRGRAREVLQVPPGTFSVGWVGRVSPEKGLDILIRALSELRDLDIHVTIIGDGPERVPLTDLGERLGLGSRVRWAGGVAEANRLFPAFDVFVLSSRTEGTPMTVFEAMEARVPIIATSVGGVPDVLSPQDALLVAPESPKPIADAIRAVVTNPTGSLTRASSAFERLRTRFAPDPWLEAYEKIYRSIFR